MAPLAPILMLSLPFAYIAMNVLLPRAPHLDRAMRFAAAVVSVMGTVAAIALVGQS